MSREGPARGAPCRLSLTIAHRRGPVCPASGQPHYRLAGIWRWLVSEHKIHYFVGQNQASFGGGTGDAAQITAWVQKHFTSQTIAGITVYNLTSLVSS
jgi:hypothetical protein